MAEILGRISSELAEIRKELVWLESDRYVLGAYDRQGKCLGEIMMLPVEAARLWQLLDGTMGDCKVLARLLDNDKQEAVWLQDEDGSQHVCIREGDSVVTLSVEDAKRFARRLQAATCHRDKGPLPRQGRTRRPRGRRARRT